MRVGIDGDILRYQIGAVCQNVDQHFGVEVVMPHSREAVEEAVDYFIEKIVEGSGAESFEVFLSGSTNFRYDIAVTDPYKGQRTKPKPYHWPTVGEILRDSYGAYTIHGAEADDILSIFARLDPDNFIIASRDKDLRIVPTWHYSWSSGEKQPEIETHKVDELGYVDAAAYPSGGYKLVGDGLRFFYGQVLSGDAIDNYKGCPGCGPKKAVAALVGCNSEQSLWEATLATYVDKLGTEEGPKRLLENARLAWLLADAELREEGMDIHVTPIELWTPPKGD